jgi:formate dehydrogenase major subunit
VLDPFGKIPEFKYCAVKVSPGGPEPRRMSFGGGVLLREQQPQTLEIGV